MRVHVIVTTKFKSRLFWLIWLAIVACCIWFFASQLARGAPPPFPSKKKWHQSAAVHQGAGAMQLITRAVIPPPTVMFTNTIAWDYPDLSTVTNFSVYRGLSPRTYTNS